MQKFVARERFESRRRTPSIVRRLHFPQLAVERQCRFHLDRLEFLPSPSPQPQRLSGSLLQGIREARAQRTV